MFLRLAQRTARLPVARRDRNCSTPTVNRVQADLPLFALDAILIFLSYVTALLLRFDGAVPAPYRHRFGLFGLLALVSHLAANFGWGLYRKMWRHASAADARAVILAGLTGAAALVVASKATVWMPLSVLAMGSGATTMAAGAVRFQSRLFASQRTPNGPAGLRVVVVGAGESGAMIVREMRRNPGAGLVVVAVVDDDPRTHGRSLAGVAVVGGINRLPEVVERFGAHQVLLAIPSAGPAVVRRVAELAEAAGVAVKVTPPVRELLGGQVSVHDVRDLRIEDLLGREQVVTDLEAVRATLVGRRVLITGAGGSIGSEIARQVALFEPAQLVLVDHDETHLFDAAATLSMTPVQVLADIRDADMVAEMMARHRPQVVFHAAAHKHVPLLEDHPCEAVATNVSGTANVARAAAEVGVERFVFISTDKAVEPTSVMGASKWLGEQLVMRLRPPGARHCAVRFGNVAGSRGSVIPTFARQISSGGPVTVTDPAMKRFFMSVHEAVQLVLQAATLAEGGEVFMLEMGQPVKILDLAERMVRLSGRNVGTDVQVLITGARPGEKMEEVLRATNEAALPTEHRSIVRLRPEALASSTLDAGVEELGRLVGRRADADALRLLFALVDTTVAPAPVVVDLNALASVPARPVMATGAPLVAMPLAATG